MSEVDRLVVDDLAADLLAAEAEVESTRRQYLWAREMLSVLLTEHHELTKHVQTLSRQLFEIREQFYELRKQFDDRRRRP